MFFWGAAVSAEAIAFEWLFIRLALKATREVPEGFWVWFFPLVLSPMFLVFVLVNFTKLQSRAKRLLDLRYLAVYLPWILGPIAANLYGRLWLQVWLALVAVPFQIWLPLRFSKKRRLLEKLEREVAPA